MDRRVPRGRLGRASRLGSILALGALAALAPSPWVTATGAAAATGPLVLAPVEGGRSIGSWREIARAGSLRADGAHVTIWTVAVLGDRLVATGSICPADHGECAAMGWHSTDGLTWLPAQIPGTRPQIVEVVRAAPGLVAVGYVGVRRWRAAIWSTTDGVRWRRRPAPPVAEARDAAGSNGVVVVHGSDDRLWVSTDLSRWRPLRRPPGMSVEHGRGGFLAWRGGGPDGWRESEVWRSSDGMAWTRVRLSRAARQANDGVGLFALAQGWILASDDPGPIFTSRNGRAWHRVPRPGGMVHGASWIVGIDDQVVANGVIVNGSYGLWTWPLGTRASRPVVMEGGIGRPFRWRGSWLLVRWEWRAQPALISLWRLGRGVPARCGPPSGSDRPPTRVIGPCSGRPVAS